jgi:signal transduction histidine kinase
MIAELLQSFATDKIRVLLVGNSETIWSPVSIPVRSELEAVLQELMVNMRKHAGAGNVVIRFRKVDGVIGITYTDDGCGIPPGALQGNGLRNTGNRMHAIGGSITFEPNGAGGLRVEMIIPTA